MGRIQTFVALAGALGVALVIGAVQRDATAQDAKPKRYNVVLDGKVSKNGFSPKGGETAADALISSVTSGGGTVTQDLSDQIGVLTITANPALVETLDASPLVEEIAEDYRWKALPDGTELPDGAVPSTRETSPRTVRTRLSRSSGTCSRSGRPRRTPPKRARGPSRSASWTRG